MQTHPAYSNVPGEERQRLLAEAHMGRLVTLPVGGGWPRIGLFPYVQAEGRFDLHLPRPDPQLADLAADPRCTFEVDEVLSFIPAGWQPGDDARHADTLYRSLVCEARAELIEDPAAIAAQIRGLLARHDPAGGHEPPTGESARYLGSLQRLVLVRLHVERQHAAFKCAQQVTAEQRARILAGLEARGTAVDRRSAELVRRMARGQSA